MIALLPPTTTARSVGRFGPDSWFISLYYYDKVIETTELLSLFSLFWNNLEAHCFHYSLTDSPTKQSENSENSELPDSSEAAVEISTAKIP
jgi:hypothetical protein